MSRIIQSYGWIWIHCVISILQALHELFKCEYDFPEAMERFCSRGVLHGKSSRLHWLLPVNSNKPYKERSMHNIMHHPRKTTKPYFVTIHSSVNIYPSCTSVHQVSSLVKIKRLPHIPSVSSISGDHGSNVFIVTIRPKLRPQVPPLVLPTNRPRLYQIYMGYLYVGILTFRI